MKRKPMCFDYTDGLFDSNVAVFAYCDWKYVRETIKKKAPEFLEELSTEQQEENTDGMYSWYKAKNGKTLRLIFLRKTDLYTIAHEVFHATVHILRVKGMKLGDDSEECYARFYEKMFKYIVNKVNLSPLIYKK